jgi:DNA-binding GntR family transcriptional regulator
MTLPQSVLAEFDWSGRVPVYLQLAERLTSAIATGDLVPDVPLDSEARMARQLGLSIETVNRAVNRLVDRGLVVRRRGIGIRVVPVKRSALASGPALTATPSRPLYSVAPQWNPEIDLLEDRVS